MAAVKEREETIESLKRDLKYREEEIERLRCEIQANPNSSLTIRATSCTETRRNTERSRNREMQQLFGGVKGDRFYTVTFKEDGARRKLCPYKLKDDISSQLKGRPKAITSSGKNGVLIEVNMQEQVNSVKQLKNIMNKEVMT